MRMVLAGMRCLVQHPKQAGWGNSSTELREYIAGESHENRLSTEEPNGFPRLSKNSSAG